MFQIVPFNKGSVLLHTRLLHTRQFIQHRHTSLLMENGSNTHHYILTKSIRTTQQSQTFHIYVKQIHEAAKVLFTIFTWSLKCSFNENTEEPTSSPRIDRKRASVTPNNRNRAVFNGTSSGQRKSCAVEDEGDLTKDHTSL